MRSESWGSRECGWADELVEEGRLGEASEGK